MDVVEEDEEIYNMDVQSCSNMMDVVDDLDMEILPIPMYSDSHQSKGSEHLANRLDQFFENLQPDRDMDVD